MVLILIISITTPPDLRPVDQGIFVGSEKAAAIQLYMTQEQLKNTGGRCAGSLFRLDYEAMKLTPLKIPEVIIG